MKMMLAGLLLAAAPARAAPAERSVRTADSSFFRSLAAFQLPAAPAYAIDLPKLLDNAQNASTSFSVGTTTVHIFGDQSDNKGGWFLGIRPEGGASRYFNAMKMVQVLGVGGTARFEVEGKKFKAHLSPNFAHLLQSRLVIESDDSQENVVADLTVEQISEAAYLAGYPLTLDGKYYRLLYARKFDETHDGKFSGFNGKRAVVLMFREKGGFGGYHFYESDIPTGPVSLKTPSYANSDGKTVKGALTFGLRLTADKRLEIHLPP